MRGCKGFTLLELSVVLIIIGLLAGGVLIGRDLIRVAQIRGQISQIERYDTAVNTFKDKYQCLPGDCIQASAFGLGTDSINSDGDIAGDGTLIMDNYEARNFWVHLANAGLIEGNYVPVAIDNIPGIHSPPLKMPGVGVRFGVSPHLVNPLGGMWIVNRRRYFEGWFFNVIHAWFLTSTLVISTYFGVYVPADVYAIDVKLDDGLPGVGKVRAVNGYYQTGLVTFPTSSLGADACVDDSVSPPQYNLDNAPGPTNNSVCSPLIKANF